MALCQQAQAGEVKGSPHLFLADGTDAPNPGIELHWHGRHGHGFPIVDREDPSMYDRLVKTAAETAT